MRLIGTLSEAELAERFQDYLIAEGVRCSLEPDASGTAIWVHDDDQVPSAKAELEKFRQDPAAEKYRTARQRADALLKSEAQRRQATRQKTVRVSDQWRAPGTAQFPVTLAVMAICVFVFAETFLMGDPRKLQELLFFSTDGTWRAIQAGDWWRVLSPAIMHGGPLHIFFNLMWWWDLGRMIEIRKGSLTLLLLTLTIAAGSNILQFQFGSPWFLGLSGVVFGLFGYTWVKGKLDPGDGVGISDQAAMWMMLWFVICIMGLAGRIANLAHFGGLAIGIIWALGSVSWRRMNRRL